MHNQIPGKEEGHVHQTVMQGLTLNAHMNLYSPHFHRSVLETLSLVTFMKTLSNKTPHILRKFLQCPMNFIADVLCLIFSFNSSSSSFGL